MLFKFTLQAQEVMGYRRSIHFKYVPSKKKTNKGKKPSLGCNRFNIYHLQGMDVNYDLSDFL